MKDRFDIKHLNEYTDLINHNSKIPLDLYEKYSVKRGLRNKDGTGVLVGLTEIGDVHGYIMEEGDKIPVQGRLRYRGYNVQDIVKGFQYCRRHGFEETAFLLLLGDIPKKDEGPKVFGLFSNRKTAALFCEILNTVFVLCRNPSLLNTGKEPSCPYLQMETCPGPCLDVTIREKYSNAVQEACDVASGEIRPTIESLHEQMSQAAQSMQFERAASLKKNIESLKKLTPYDFRWVRNLEDLCILHIDLDIKRKIAGKNKKRPLYKTYKITAKNVYELGTFVPKSPKQIMSFLNHTWNCGQEVSYTFKPKEHLATLSLFLFRSNQSGLWLDCTEAISKDSLFKQLQEIFGIKFCCKSAEKKDVDLDSTS